MLTNKDYKSRMLNLALAECDISNHEASLSLQATMIITLINKGLTLDSLKAMLALIFVYFMALISPIQTPDLSTVKTLVPPSKNIKAVQFLSFT